jgi:hypothetical protein
VESPVPLGHCSGEFPLRKSSNSLYPKSFGIVSEWCDQDGNRYRADDGKKAQKKTKMHRQSWYKKTPTDSHRNVGCNHHDTR